MTNILYGMYIDKLYETWNLMTKVILLLNYYMLYKERKYFIRRLKGHFYCTRLKQLLFLYSHYCCNVKYTHHEENILDIKCQLNKNHTILMHKLLFLTVYLFLKL